MESPAWVWAKSSGLVLEIIGFLISGLQFNSHAPKPGICSFILPLDDCSPRFELPPNPKPHNLGWIIAQVITAVI